MATLKPISYYNQYAKDFTKKTWGKELNIPVEFNRTKRYLGLFKSRTSYTGVRSPLVITLSKVALKDHDSALNTLKHELCHWHAYTEYQDYHDGDDFFEKLLLSVGAGSSGTGGHLGLSRIIQESSEAGRKRGSDGARFIKTEDPKDINKFKSNNWKLEYVQRVYEKDVYLGLIFRVSHARSGGKGWVTEEIAEQNLYYPNRRKAFYDLFRKKYDEMQSFVDNHTPS